MRWAAKATIQNGLAVLPGGESLNYTLQRRITHSLPADDRQFDLHAREAIEHARRYESLGDGKPLSGTRCYEFGAGWDLIGPLALYALGADTQTLVDIQPILRMELVNHSLATFARHRDALQEAAGRPLRNLGAPDLASREDLAARFGIRYLAPCDARATGFAADSFDLVSSTFTLEHIPGPDIEAILVESRRILSPTGLVSCSVDMQDHYSFNDESISAYNFLRYSERRWRMVNSSLQHQNRLRAPDYVRIFERAGFEVLAADAQAPTDADLAAVAALDVHPRFARYSPEELATRSSVIVARPAPSGHPSR